MAHAEGSDRELTPSEVDLSAHNAQELAFDLDLSLVDAAPLIDGLQGKGIKPARPSLFAFEQVYQAGGKTHSARAWLELHEGALHLSVRYRLVSALSQVPGQPLEQAGGGLTVAELLRQSTVVEELVSVQCRASFEHNGDKYRSFFQLPQAAGTEAQGLYDEIRGVRLAKTEGDQTVYEVVIDQPDNDTIHDSVTFAISEQLGAELPSKLLDIAAEVSSYFVRPIGR